ncbi:MAG: hypothetical protein DRQ78_05390 [Epsilonproteobacteria bacterium]|nr:MAG: hypothetical protein DRQ78_05390 [Campylobacterota bacterium]
MTNLETRKQESLDAIKALRRIKATLTDDLSEVRVALDEDANPSIKRAIDQIFGEMKENDPRKGYITFDMYMECLRILKAAGQAKASSILEREFV